MSWDEIVLTGEVPPAEARRALERVLNEAVNSSITAVGAVEPILVASGPAFRAAFTARGRVTVPYGLELCAGPAETDCRNVGHAIGIARQTARLAVTHLAQLFDGKAVFLAENETKKDLNLGQ